MPGTHYLYDTRLTRHGGRDADCRPSLAMTAWQPTGAGDAKHSTLLARLIATRRPRTRTQLETQQHLTLDATGTDADATGQETRERGTPTQLLTQLGTWQALADGGWGR